MGKKSGRHRTLGSLVLLAMALGLAGCARPPQAPTPMVAQPTAPPTWPPTGGTVQIPDLIVDVGLVEEVAQNREEDAQWDTLALTLALMVEEENPAYARVFVALLEREDPIRLAADSPWPGVMWPLDTLKAAAMEGLMRLDGRSYIAYFQRVYEQARDPVLRALAEGYLLELGQVLPPASPTPTTTPMLPAAISAEG